MLSSLIIYILFIGVLFCLSRGYIKYTKDTTINCLNPYVTLIFIIYVALCSVRYDVGVDYESYLIEFLSASKYSNADGLTTTEVGWNHFTWALSKNHIHYTIFFGIIAFLQFLFLIKSFSHEKYLLPYLIIAFFIQGYFIDFQNVLRQNIINVVFLYIVMRHRNIKFLHYAVIVALCFLIHKSSVVLLLLFPLIKYDTRIVTKHKLCLVILVVCCIIGYVCDLFAKISQSPIFLVLLSQTDYSVYTNEGYLNQGTSKTIGLGFLLKFLVDCVLVYSSKNVFNNVDKNQKVLYSICYQLFFIGTCARYLFPTSMILGRPLLYLLIFNIPIMTYYLYYVFNTKYHKWSIIKFINIVSVVSLVLLFLVNHVVNPEGNKAEWDFYWNHNVYSHI